MNLHPTRRAPSRWTIEHPGLYACKVVIANLLALLAILYFADWLKGVLPC